MRSRELLLGSDLFGYFSSFNNERTIVKGKNSDKDASIVTRIVEVPGFEKEKLSVKMVDDYLCIMGEREDGKRISYREFVGPNVITKAHLKNGILTITFKREYKETEISIEE